VVDNDEGACRALSRLLRSVGIQPVAYSSAEAFLADEKQPKFDCLVLDVQLAGLELQPRKVGAGNKTPVIFLAAGEDVARPTATEAGGGAAFFLKTAPGSEVVDMIRRLTA
jgi:FixJ family two-component response regulator